MIAIISKSILLLLIIFMKETSGEGLIQVAPSRSHSIVMDLFPKSIHMFAYEGRVVEIRRIWGLQENVSYILKWEVCVSMEHDMESFHSGSQTFTHTTEGTPPFEIEILPLRPGVVLR